MHNNHGSWYDTTWLSIALFNGNTTAERIAVDEVKERRIAKQILPDGKEWIELERNVPSGYCQYNLLAMTQAADLSKSATITTAQHQQHQPDSDSICTYYSFVIPRSLKMNPNRGCVLLQPAAL